MSTGLPEPLDQTASEKGKPILAVDDVMLREALVRLRGFVTERLRALARWQMPLRTARTRGVWR
jgi:hypothetical protein